MAEEGTPTTASPIRAEDRPIVPPHTFDRAWARFAVDEGFNVSFSGPAVTAGEIKAREGMSENDVVDMVKHMLSMCAYVHFEDVYPPSVPTRRSPEDLAAMARARKEQRDARLGGADAAPT